MSERPQKRRRAVSQREGQGCFEWQLYHLKAETPAIWRASRSECEASLADEVHGAPDGGGWAGVLRGRTLVMDDASLATAAGHTFDRLHKCRRQPGRAEGNRA